MSRARAWAAVALALAAVLGLAGCSSDSKAGSDAGGSAGGNPSTSASTPAAATGRQTPPPWDPPADAVRYIRAAGLPPLEAEGAKVHYHAHLDVLVDGEAVTVPAFIGIDEQARRISPLHTHTPDGIVHVEAPRKDTFTLGQLFTEWNVRLTETCLGSLCAGSGKSLRLYVDGKARPGDPATLVLAAHQQIALVYGDATAQQQVPSSYDFPNGL